MALALKQFAAEREDYYHSVEGHVVKLALAIARKILHREAQIDPLLLSGAVRVALEKVSSATLVRLYVHPDQVQTWKEFLARQSDISRKPEILGDPAVVEGQCRVESSIGTADLSLESQITEIERGFFDLLAQRPETAMKDAAAQLNPYFRSVTDRSTTRWTGRVVKAIGHLVESEGPISSLGECCEILSSNGAVPAKGRLLASAAQPSCPCP